MATERSVRPFRILPRRSLPALLVLTALLASWFTAPAGAVGKAGGKVVLILIDRVDAEDLSSGDTPFLNELASSWSTGLMVTRPAEGPGGGSADGGGEYVTLGAGARCFGATASKLSFNSSERFVSRGKGVDAGEVFRRYTGDAPPPGGVVSMGWQEVVRNNRDRGGGEPGLLGGMLSRSGLRCAVVGNQDTYGNPRRPAPLICCDPTGAVLLGDVGEGLTVYDPESAGAQRTDERALVAASCRLLRAADLLVVDTGDTARIDSEEREADDSLLDRQRRDALRRADAVAGALYDQIDVGRSMIIVLSPAAPARRRREGNYLTPLVAAGGGFGAGALTSRSTRRQGLVSNTDIAPTILEFFHLEPPDTVVGSVMETSADADAVASLRALSERMGVALTVRWPLMIGYLALGLVMVVLAAVRVLAPGGLSGRPGEGGPLAGALAPATIVLLCVPLSFLVVSLFEYTGYVFPALFCFLFAAVLGTATWALSRSARRLDPVVFVCILTGLSIVVDQFTGGRLLLLPLMGSSSLEGMRSYGLSNTIAGILIAVSVWAVAALGGRDPVGPPRGASGAGHRTGRARLAAALVLAAVALVIGIGPLGANVGGFVTAFATFLVFCFCSGERGLNWRRSLLVAVLTALGTFLLVLTDACFFGSHAGRVARSGASGVVSIISRKISIQLGQIAVVLLPALLLMLAVAAAVIWAGRKQGFWARQWECDRPLTATLYSLLVGSVVGLVFNDTGITIMGSMMLVTGLALCYYSFTGRFPVPSTADAVPAASGSARATPAC